MRNGEDATINNDSTASNKDSAARNTSWDGAARNGYMNELVLLEREKMWK